LIDLFCEPKANKYFQILFVFLINMHRKTYTYLRNFHSFKRAFFRSH